MEILKTYRLADFGGGLIDETAELKLVAEKSQEVLQDLQSVLDNGNESTTQDAIFRLDADKYLKINRANQSIEIWDLNIDSISPIVYFGTDIISVRNGSGSYSIMETESIGAVSPTDTAILFANSLFFNGASYPLPNGASSQIATLLDIDNAVSGMLDLRGAHDASSNAFPTTGGSGTSGAILKGDFWYVSVAGVLNGVAVNIGDSFFALNDSPTSGQWQILESNLGFVPENVANKNNTTLNNSSTEYPTSGLVLKEREPIVVSTSQTAVLNRVHNVEASATLTDPTPIQGMGYNVNVINGVATVGGVDYSVGSQLFRHYHSGSWRTNNNNSKVLTLNQTTNYSLIDTTAKQKIFDSTFEGGNAGELIVEAGSYLFLMTVENSNLSSSSKQIQNHFGGTAVVNQFLMMRTNRDAQNASVTNASVGLFETSFGFVGSPTGIFNYRGYQINGTLTFANGGSFIPEFLITVSQSGMLTLAGSSLVLIKI